MLEFTQNELVDVICDWAKGIATSSSKGTYDQADPTVFEKYEVNMELLFSNEEGCGVLGDVKINIFDCTWGVEFEITTPEGVEGGYWSRSFGGIGDSEWLRTTDGFFSILKRVFHEQNSAEMVYRDQEFHHCYE